MLDLHAQWRGFEKDGQWRFTPPTHCVLALSQALEEMTAEGGATARRARYVITHELQPPTSLLTAE